MKLHLTCLLWAAVFLTSGAADLSKEEMQSLYQETMKSCREGDFDRTLSLIDTFYSADNLRTAPPYTWAGNSKWRKLAGGKVSGSGVSPESFLAAAAARCATPQARFELYCAYARFEADRARLESRKLQDEAGKLAGRKDDLSEQLMDANDAERTDLRKKIEAINAEVARLNRQSEGLGDARIREVMEWYLRNEKQPSWVSYYGLMMMANPYHEKLNPAPADGETVLEIISRTIPGAEPDARSAEALLDMRIEALLRLGRGADALPLIEKQAEFSRYQDQAGKAIILLERGRALLAMKRIDEARTVADELEKAGVKTDPLKSWIRQFIRAARQ